MRNKLLWFNKPFPSCSYVCFKTGLGALPYIELGFSCILSWKSILFPLDMTCFVTEVKSSSEIHVAFMFILLWYKFTINYLCTKLKYFLCLHVILIPCRPQVSQIPQGTCTYLITNFKVTNMGQKRFYHACMYNHILWCDYCHHCILSYIHVHNCLL